jgi:hypothetical protein
MAPGICYGRGVKREVRMRLVILAAALALPAGSGLAQPASPAAVHNPNKFTGARLDCMANRVQHAVHGPKGKFNRLGELPPGDLQRAVVRQVEGCQQPVIVREGYGAMAQPERRR